MTESDSDLEVWGECFLSFSHVSVTRLSNSKQKPLVYLIFLKDGGLRSLAVTPGMLEDIVWHQGGSRLIVI